ncbi:methyltransferase domain-containing protein [Candidatus Woesearchaeota archaeon]|nr:methyltransferase domain-containing protein [Candidatus Woesearchaeota archaeon]
MRNKIISMFVIYLLLAYSISIGVNAEPPKKTSEYPENGKAEEQEKWILENPNLFSPSNPSQKDAFRRAYEKGNVKYPTHIESVTNYVSTFNNGIPSGSDRKIASEYVSYFMKKTADLKEGDIKILVDSRTQAANIVTSDGVRHDILQLSKIEDLVAIKSKEDGTLELITKDKGNINLKGTSISVNQNKEFVTSNGQTIKFESNQGKVINLEVDGGNLKVSCKIGCVLSKGYATIELRDGGYYKDLGGNRYQVEDGTTKLGQNQLSGKYTFGLNIDKDGHTTLDFTKAVELSKFGKAENLRNSFMHIEDPQANDGKLHFGNVDIATGSGQKGVVACFDCKDKNNLETFDGYVKFEPFKNSNCNSASCETVYKAQMKGLIAARFEKDAFHEGFDKNLVVSYYPNGKDASNTEMGIFTLESCKGCKVGTGEIVGVQTLNNNFFQINNQYYSDEKQEPQLRYEQINVAKQAIPYIQFVKFNKEGIAFFDKDVYKDSKLLDTLHTGIYKSDILTGRDTGGKSVAKYLEEFYSKEYKDNPIEVENRVKGVVKEISNPQNLRNIYVIDNTAFKYDKNGNKIDVQNLYITTKDNQVITDQIGAVESGKYAEFFKRESTKEIVGLLDRKGLIGKERQEEFERLSQLKNDEIFFKTRLQSLSAIIDKGREIHESNAPLFRVIKDVINALPVTEAQIKEAQRYIGDYQSKYEGSKKIFEMRSNGLTLDEIYKNSGSSPQIKAAFQEPYLVHKLNQELILKTELQMQEREVRPEQKINIYYLENGELKTKSANFGDANRVSALDASQAYLKDTNTYSSDTRLAFDIYAQQIASELRSKEETDAFEKFKQNLISNSKADGVHYNRYKEGSIFAYSNEKDFAADGVKPSNYVKLADGRYFVASPEIIKMVKDGKIDPNDLIELSQINQKYQQDERAKQLKMIVDALIPSNSVEAAVNLATGYGPLVKGALGVYKARTVMKAALAAAELTGNVALGGLIGVTRGGSTTQEGIKVFRAIDSKDQRAVIGVGTYVATTEKEARKYGSEVKEFVLDPNTKLLVLDSSNEVNFRNAVIQNVDRKKFLKMENEYGFDRALETATSDYAKNLGYDGIDGSQLGAGIVVYDSRYLVDAAEAKTVSKGLVSGSKEFSILPDIAKNKNVFVEIGSGDGLTTVLGTKRFYDDDIYVGIEINERLVKGAQQLNRRKVADGENIYFVVGDVSNLQLPEGFAKEVYLGNLVGYGMTPRASIDKIIEEAKRIAGNDGLIVFRETNTPLNIDEFKKLLDAHGISIQEITYPHSPQWKEKIRPYDRLEADKPERVPVDSYLVFAKVKRK